MIESENCQFWLGKAQEAVSARSQSMAEWVRHQIGAELEVEGLSKEEHDRIESVLDCVLSGCCG